jgi:hypothetical protein
MPPTRQHSATQAKINTTIKSLNYNLGAEGEEYEGRQKELKGVAMRIMARLYQVVMPGGIVCMPGIKWNGRRCFLLSANTSSNHRGGRLILR